MPTVYEELGITPPEPPKPEGKQDAKPDIYKELGVEKPLPPAQDIADYGKRLLEGAAGSFVTSFGQGLKMLGGSDATVRAGQRIQKNITDSLSPAGKAALGDVPFNWEKKEFSERPGQAILNAVVSSLPGMVQAYKMGAPLAGGAQAAGAKAAEALTRAGAPGIVSKGANAIVSGAPFAAIEGVQAGLGGAAQVGEEIRKTPLEKLQTAPGFQAAFNATDPALPMEQRLAQAREAAADAAEREVLGRTTLSTGGIGLATGGGALGSVARRLTGRGASEAAKDGALMAIGKGALSESINEAPQSGGERLIQNLAVRQYADPTRDPMQGVIEDAILGAAAGGVMGGVGAGGARLLRRGEQEQPNTPQQGGPIAPEGGQPSQAVEPPSAPPAAGLSESDAERAMSTMARTAQADMNAQRGPLSSAVQAGQESGAIASAPTGEPVDGALLQKQRALEQITEIRQSLAPDVDLANTAAGRRIGQLSLQARKFGATDDEVEAAMAGQPVARAAPERPAASQPAEEWQAFPPESGSLGVPRAEMPQISADRRGALVQFLKARGIESTTEEVPATALKPAQAEFSPSKVRQATEYSSGDRSILVSSDGYIVDGHHQWLAKAMADQPVKAIRLNAPINTLLETVKAFPSSERAAGATDASAAPTGTLASAPSASSAPASPEVAPAAPSAVTPAAVTPAAAPAAPITAAAATALAAPSASPAPSAAVEAPKPGLERMQAARGGEQPAAPQALPQPAPVSVGAVTEAPAVTPATPATLAEATGDQPTKPTTAAAPAAPEASAVTGVTPVTAAPAAPEAPAAAQPAQPQMRTPQQREADMEEVRTIAAAANRINLAINAAEAAGDTARVAQLQQELDARGQQDEPRLNALVEQYGAAEVGKAIIQGNKRAMDEQRAQSKQPKKKAAKEAKPVEPVKATEDKPGLAKMKKAKAKKEAAKPEAPAAEQPSEAAAQPAERAAPEAPAVKPEQPATEAQHVEDGKIKEASPEVVRDAIETSAEKTEFNPAEAKSYLLGEVDRALKDAPAEADLGLSRNKAGALGVGKERLDEIGYVTFKVPGDGTFRVLKTAEALKTFRDKVDKSPGFKAPPKRRAASSAPRAGGSPYDSVRHLLEDGEYGAALELASALDRPFGYGASTEGRATIYTDNESAPILSGLEFFVGRQWPTPKKGGAWAVIETRTGLSIARGDSQAAAIKAAKKTVAEAGEAKVREAVGRNEKVGQDVLAERARTALEASERAASVTTETVERAQESLPADARAAIDEHYKGDLKRIVEDVADTIRGVALGVSQAVKRALDLLVKAVLSLAVAFNVSSFDAEAKPLNIPLPKTEQTLVQTIEKPRADFGAIQPGAEARFVADWVVGSKNNFGKPFTIVDKQNAQAYVFGADGKIIAAAPVLLGKAFGDTVSEETLNKPIGQTTDAEKITPAGRTEARIEKDATYGSMLVFRDGARSYYAMHRMYTATPSEMRPQRLASTTVNDNRISYGCINVGPDFYNSVIVPTFKAGGVMYVMPDQQTLADTFPGIADYRSTETIVTQIVTAPSSMTGVSTLGGQPGVNREQRTAVSRASRRREKNKGGAQPESRISPRRPTAKNAVEDALADTRLQPSIEAIQQNKKFALLVMRMSRYPNFAGMSGPVQDRLAAIKERLVSNLLWLYDRAPADLRERGRTWYVGGNAIANRMAARYDAPVRNVAAVMAALSPQKDWFQNVSLGERLMTALTEYSDVPWSPEMTATMRERPWGQGILKSSRGFLGKVEGKTLRDLWASGDKKAVYNMAVWIRAWDETNNPQMARVVTPEGTFGDWDRSKKGDPVKLRSQSFSAMVKAIRLFAAKDLQTISELIGDNHKVRSFYNNLIDPTNTEDVTIDTHAVAAALLRPLGSSDTEVGHNFGAGMPNSKVTGAMGTYGLFADAYREAARQRNILPREMQSVTWEAVRGLFRPEQKRILKGTISQLWRRHAAGEITLAQVRSEILKLAQGITRPAWLDIPAGRPTGDAQGGRDSSYAEELYRDVLPGRGSKQLSGGTRDGTARESSQGRLEGPAFLRGEIGTATPGRRTEIAAQVQALAANWRNAPDIILLDTPAQAPFDAPADARGAYQGGKVYLFAANLPTEGWVEETVFHESMGHYGLRRMLGTDYLPIMRQIAARNAGVRESAARWRANNPRPSDIDAGVYEALSIEEALAQMAQAGARISGLQSLAKRLIEALRAIGFERIANWLEGATNAEVAALLAQSRQYVEQGGPSPYTAAAPAFSRPAPIFYSALTAKVEELTLKSAPASQWKGTLQGLTSKGAKRDELEWSGVMEWLDLQQGKVDKQAVLDYLAANGVRVEETVLGDQSGFDEQDRYVAQLQEMGWTVDFEPENGQPAVLTDRDGQEFMEDDTGLWSTEEGDATIPPDVEAVLENLKRASERAYEQSPGGTLDTKFKQYTLPGGENYRELLLTLPKGEPTFALDDYLAELSDKYGWEQQGVMRRPAWTNDQLTPDELAKLERLQKAAPKDYARGETFQSSHWNEPNVLAHIRFNERTDAEGRRVMFVEEIQSDWGQQGKKKGFAESSMKPVSRKEFDAYVDGLLDAYVERQVRAGEDRREAERRRIHMPLSEMAATLGRADEYARMRAGRNMDINGERGVPRAPFVEKTEAWTALAVKRALRWAVDNGFDVVAFTTGQQNADRYDLSKQIDSITLRDSDRRLIARATDGRNVLAESGVSDQRIEELLGKEIAQKLAEAKPDSNGVRLIEGDGLKMGGEGMRTYYDRIVPNVANDVLKKIGGGRMGAITFATGFTPSESEDGTWVVSRGDHAEGWGLSQTEAVALAAELNANGPLSQPAILITPAMRETISRGLPLFSRASDETPIQRQRVLVTSMAEALSNFTDNRPAFNLYHRTFSTQAYKAKVDSDFGRVFKPVQAYMNDTSLFAVEAAEMAPNIVPMVGSVKGAINQLLDVTTNELKPYVMRQLRIDPQARSQAQRDMGAAAKALFKGTLEDSKVYSDEDLQKQGLTASQISLYREARAAIDHSLDTLGTSTLIHVVRNVEELADARAQVYRGMSFDKAHLTLTNALADASLQLEQERARLNQRIKATPEDLRGALKQQKAMLDNRLQRFLTFQDDLDQTLERITKLKAEGYAPLMRFGDWAVDVRDGSGKTIHFEMREGRVAANRAAREMQQWFGQGYNVTVSPMNSERFTLFQGITPEVIDVFGKAAGLTEDQVYQDYLRMAVADRSAMKRLIHRKGTPGFVSDDLSRVLASFITSNARLSSKNWHYGEMLQAAADIPREKGDVGREAARLVKFVQNPTEEWAAIRGAMFAYFIGGSFASAIVNMSQPFMQTFPELSKYVSAVKAKGTLLASLKDSVVAPKGSLGEAMRRAEQEGIVAPHEIHQLYAEAINNLGGGRGVRAAMTLWGSFFSLAEQFNRRVSFAAAYKIAEGMSEQERAAKGMGNPYDFAVDVIETTQGIYARHNRPNIARSGLGATVLTFKQFSITYIEQMVRMAWKGPDGKRNLGALAIMLGMLVLAAGVEGLPFAEDAEDLIDTIGQAMGYNTNSKAWIDRALRKHLGETAGELALRGASTVLPFDFSARLSLGNLIPGSGMFKADANVGQQMTELIGPAGGLIRQAMSGWGALSAGSPGKAAQEASPKAIRDVVQAVDMWSTGAYRDAKGYKVINTTQTDAIIKGFGFQPQSVAEAQREIRMDAQTIAVARKQETAIADRWARGIIDGDPEAVAKARQDWVEWNSKNPNTPIRITPDQIRRRVIEAQMTKEQRQLRSTPKELRPYVMER